MRKFHKFNVKPLTKRVLCAKIMSLFAWSIIPLLLMKETDRDAVSLAFSKPSSKSIHFVAWIRTSFLEGNNFYCMYKPRFIYIFIYQWHLSCFQLLVF